MPKESVIVTRIKDYLNSHCGCICMKYHGSAYGMVGHPDLYGILGDGSGRFFAIEVKVPGKKPTPAQYKFLERIEDAGGLAFWVDSLEQVKEVIPTTCE